MKLCRDGMVAWFIKQDDVLVFRKCLVRGVAWGLHTFTWLSLKKIERNPL